ncbi:2'-5' RNA ligase family protein [Roseateles sp. P5_E1]
MSRPRYLFMACPSADAGDCIETAIQGLHLDQRLRTLLVARANWHQSLSGRYWPDEMPEVEQLLLRAGGLIAAHAVTMTLSWIVSNQGYSALKPRGMPAGFVDLLRAINAALAKQGLSASAQDAPHITLSYLAAIADAPIAIEPIDWTIDRVLLVRSEGDGAGYRYSEVASWELPAAPLAPQIDLF